MPSLRDAVPTIGTLGVAALREALAADGLVLDVGLVRLRVRSDVPALAEQLAQVYRHFPFEAPGPWADIHIDLRRARGLRGYFRPQVTLGCDGRWPADPFPIDSPLPLLEWGTNWYIARRCNHRLLLHAGVVERDGLALIMPAVPGSGKSTLTAALSLDGWRLLSDEFGAVDLESGQLWPVLKPPALKNASIPVIDGLFPRVERGPSFPKTRRGTVTHLAPGPQAVQARFVPALPGAVLFPKWEAGAAAQWIDVSESAAFTELALNSFNYITTGVEGFRCVVRLLRSMPAWQLTYSDLPSALIELRQRWPEVLAQSAARRAAANERQAEDERL